MWQWSSNKMHVLKGLFPSIIRLRYFTTTAPKQNVNAVRNQNILEYPNYTKYKPPTSFFHIVPFRWMTEYNLREPGWDHILGF